MSGSVRCPQCGSGNSPASNFCSNCAARLNVVGPQPTVSQEAQWSAARAQLFGPPPGNWGPAEMERSIGRRADIDKTKTGLLLAIFGVILGAVPFVPYIGGVLVIIGMILVLLGADAFGGSHSGYVKGSLVLVILGIVIDFVVVLAATSSFAPPALNGAGQVLTPESVTAIFNEVLSGLVLGGIVLGIAYVLLTYGLQEQSGRLELYTAFVAQLAVGILVAYVFSGLVSTALNPPAGSFGFDLSQIRNLLTQLQYLQLAGLIPACLFADAYYRIYSRISNGDLPQRPRPLRPTGPRYTRT